MYQSISWSSKCDSSFNVFNEIETGLHYVLNVNPVTPVFFQKAFKIHQFRNLQQFTLYDSDAVTKEIIDMLLNDDNAIKVIRICICGITSLLRGFIDEWNKKIIAKHWDCVCRFRQHQRQPQRRSSGNFVIRKTLTNVN